LNQGNIPDGMWLKNKGALSSGLPRREPICNDQYCENPEGYPTDLIESLLGQGNFPDGLFTGALSSGVPKREPICNDQYCENPDGYPTDLIESLLGQGNIPEGFFTNNPKTGALTVMPPGGPKRVSPSKPSVIEIYGKCDPVKPLQRKIGGKPNYIGYMKICRLKLPKKDCISIDLCKTEFHGYGLRYEGCDRYEQCTLTIQKPCIPGYNCGPMDGPWGGPVPGGPWGSGKPENIPAPFPGGSLSGRWNCYPAGPGGWGCYPGGGGATGPSGPWGSKSTGGFGTRGGWGGNPTGPGGPWGGYPIGPGRPQPPRPVFYGPHEMSGPSAFEQEYIGPESTEQEQPLFEALAGGNNAEN